MKRLVCFFVVSMLVFLVSCTTEPDEDRPEWNAAEVCPEMGTNAYGMPNRGSFTDERDGQVYRYTTIGNQVWMAENLRYAAPYSTCSNDTSFIRQYCELIEHNCETMQCCKESLCHNFGRYYSIIKGGGGTGLIDQILADTICPKGWHIPTKEDWDTLDFAMKTNDESNYNIATRIKSSDSVFFSMSKMYPNQHDRTLAGTDNCALSVLPSGFMHQDGETLEFRASFLTTTQKSDAFIYTFIVQNYTDYVRNYYRNSIRCVMD